MGVGSEVPVLCVDPDWMDLVAIPGAKLVVSEGKGYTDVYQEMVRGKFPCEVKPEKRSEEGSGLGSGKIQVYGKVRAPAYRRGSIRFRSSSCSLSPFPFLGGFKSSKLHNLRAPSG